MAKPGIDFSHLTPEERLQLIEDLWDSLDSASLLLSEAQAAELDRRMELHRRDPDRGTPWEEVLRDIERGR